MVRLILKDRMYKFEVDKSFNSLNGAIDMKVGYNTQTKEKCFNSLNGAIDIIYLMSFIKKLI